MADTKTKLRELADALSSVRSRSIETRDALQELSELLAALAERTPALEENKLKGYKNQLAETKDILQGVQTSLKTLAKEGDVFTQLGRMVREYISDIEVANKKQAELFKPLAPEGKKPFTTLGPKYDLTKITSAIRDINDELDKSNLKALRFKQTLGMIDVMRREASEYATGLGPQAPPSTTGVYTPATAEERAGRALTEVQKLDFATQAWEAHTRALGIDNAVLETLYVTYKKVLTEAQKFAEARREWTRQPTAEEWEGPLHKEALSVDPTKRDFMRVDKTLFKDLAGMTEDILEVGLGASEAEERFKAAAIHSGVLALNVKTVKEAVQEIPKQIQEELIIKAPTLHEMDVSQIQETTKAEEAAVVTKEKLTQATDIQAKAMATVIDEFGHFARIVDPKELDATIATYRQAEQILKDLGKAMTDLVQTARGGRVHLAAEKIIPGWSKETSFDDRQHEEVAQAIDSETASIEKQVAPTKELTRTKEELTQTLKQLYHELAKQVHPDLAPAGGDVGLRTEVMTRVNLAFGRGDLEELEHISKKLSQEGIESFRGLGEAIKDVATQREAGAQATTDSADIERAQQAILEISIDRHKQKAQALKDETVAQKDANQALAIGPPSGPGGGARGPLSGPPREGEPRDIPTQIIGTRDDIAEAYKKEGVYLAVVDKALTLFIEKNKFAEAAGNKFRVELDMINQSVRVSALVFKDWNEQTGERRYKTKAELETMAVSFTGQEIDKRGQLKEQFEVWTDDATIAERAVVNLTSAAEKMGGTIDDIGPGQTNYNDNLARFSVVTRNAFGQVQRGTVTMDRFGNVAQTVKSKYETFADAIGNSINKVIRWGIAVGVVYGTMRKLRQGMSDMIEMQSSMSDIAVVTGQSMDQVGNSLNVVAEAAERTGITLVEALSAYEKALRATGDFTNETERAAAANELLAQTLVFSRLGTIDVTQAMDIMVGALRQSNMEISEAEDLLDKWVATTKTAYVSLEDLGEGFAITAAQAQAVGVSIDQLNGIIATVAKATTLSSTEIGNFTRTMLAALESDQAVKVLRQHGVAIKNIEGEYRDWGDVIQDISDLFRTGAISEKELSKIGIALGGGRRRGPQFIAFLKEYSEVGRIAEISANAQGDAADALNIKMEDLRNTVNGLQVAISKMVAAAGMEGGLLELMTNLVSLVTTATGALTELSKVFGTSTTKVLAFVAAYATLKKLGVGAKLSGMLSTGAAGATGLDPRIAAMGMGGMGGADEASKSFAEGAKGYMKRGMPYVGAALGMGALEYMTSGSIARTAGATLGAGVGAAAGAALGSFGGPIGTIIGASLGAALMGEVKSTIQQAETKRAYERKLERGEDVTFEEALTVLTEAIDNMRDPIDRLTKRGPIIGGQLPAPVWEARIPEELIRTAELQIEKLTESLAGKLPYEEILGTLDGQRDVISQEIKELQELIAKVEELTPAVEENTKALKERDPAAFAERRATLAKQIEPGVRRALEVEGREQIMRFARGEAPRASVTRQKAVSTQLPDLMTQMADTMPDLVEEFGRGQKAIEELAVEMSHLDPLAIEELQKYVGGLGEYQRELDRIDAITNKTTAELTYLADVERAMGRDAEIAATFFEGLREELKRSTEVQVPTGFMRLPEDLSSEQIDAAIADARKMQDEFAKAVGVAPKILRDQASEITTLYDKEFDEILELNQNFLDYMLQQYVEAQEALEDSFSVRRLKDVSPEKFGEIQARNRYWVEFLARIKGMTTPEYLEEEGYTENLVMGPNNVWQKILTTNEAMSFTLQDILETEKKQLEGMWNIPSGATFWVPLTSLFYQQQAGAGGVPELPPLEDLQRPSGEFLPDPGDLVPKGRPKAEEEEPDYARMRGRKPRGIPGAEEARREETEATVKVIRQIREVAEKLDADPKQYAAILQKMYKIGEAIGITAPEAARQAAAELAGAMEDLTPRGQIETLDSRIQGLFDSASNTITNIGEFFTAPLDFNIVVDVVSDKVIQIMNTITLDGTFIKRYMSEVNAREIGSAARSSGYADTLRD